MENNERDRKLEQWLDEALSEYGAAEPRFGLEQRVLNRVRGQEPVRARRWSRWKWMPAFAAIAAVMIVGWAIRPVLMLQSVPSQMSSRMDQPVSPQQSERKVAPQVSDRLEVGPAKKAAAKQESGVGEHDKDALEPVTGNSQVRADSTTNEIRDARGAANDLAIAGSVATVVAGPPPPPPPPPGEGVLAGPVHQPTSEAAILPNGPARQRVEIVDESAPTVAVHLDQEKIPLRAAPSWSPTADANSATATAPSGIVSTETLSVNGETAAFKRIRTKKPEQAQSAAARGEDANVIDAFGMKLRTDIKQTAAGPIQFPTPAPLSEQEKLVMAAAKKMKDAPVKQDGGPITAIEIKEIEITPLEGPKK